MNLKKQLIKNFLGVGSMKILSIPVGLVTSIILARTLEPEGFGQYAFVMALIPLLSLPVNGGLLQLITREVASFVHSRSWSLYSGLLRAAHFWVVLIALIVSGAYWMLVEVSNLVFINEKWSLLSIAILMVPLGGLAAVRIGTIKGQGLPAYAEIPGQLVQPLITLSICAILAWRGALDTTSAIWTQVTVAVFIFLLASWMFYRVQPIEIKSIVPEYRLSTWAKSLLPFSMIALVSTFNAQIGIIALGIFSTDEQVAAMRVAERAGQFVVMSLTIVNMVIAPYIVRAHKDKDMVLLQKLAQKSARGSFFLALPVALVFFFAGEPLIRYTFGADYSSISYWPVVIIALGQLFNVAFGSVGYFLTMSGYERETLKGQLLALFVNIILCILLVPMLGAIGAAIGVSIGIISWNMLLFMIVKRRLGIHSAAF